MKINTSGTGVKREKILHTRHICRKTGKFLLLLCIHKRKSLLEAEWPIRGDLNEMLVRRRATPSSKSVGTFYTPG